MNLIPVSTPGILKSWFPKYTWDLSNRNTKTIYLTFDDGPIPEATPFVLECLKQYNAKATFFCIGDNIKKHPKIFQNIIDDGHRIGNHTMHHIKAWKNSDVEYLNNIHDCETIIGSFVQNPTRLFRPPYGQISISKFKKLLDQGYQIILWDVLAKDWETRTLPATCARNVIQNAKNGSIIVFHDSIKAYRSLSYALPLVLKHFSDLGYRFEKI